MIGVKITISLLCLTKLGFLFFFKRWRLINRLSFYYLINYYLRYNNNKGGMLIHNFWSSQFLKSLHSWNIRFLSYVRCDQVSEYRWNTQKLKSLIKWNLLTLCKKKLFKLCGLYKRSLHVYIVEYIPKQLQDLAK